MTEVLISNDVVNDIVYRSGGRLKLQFILKSKRFFGVAEFRPMVKILKTNTWCWVTWLHEQQSRNHVKSETYAFALSGGGAVGNLFHIWPWTGDESCSKSENVTFNCRVKGVLFLNGISNQHKLAWLQQIILQLVFKVAAITGD